MIRCFLNALRNPAVLALIWTGQASAADFAGLQQMYDGAMLPGVEVTTFANTERLLPVRVVHRGETARMLPKRAKPFPRIHFVNQGRHYDLYDYMATNRVAGLLVLKEGEIAFEDYELGTGPDTHWASFSMAKSITSTLVGAALVDGFISSLDDPVVRYVPALSGSAYDGVSIRQILTMSSGVRWNETYTDPKSDRRRVLDLQIAGKPGEVLRYMGSLPRAAAPGSIWNYSTGETFVLGAVVEGATHRHLADYLSEKIWSPAGMEQNATWWVDGPDGLAWAGSGIGATLRDYGRFGLIAADRGRLNDRPIVPETWFAEAGIPHEIGGKAVDYGYMWWIPPQSTPIHAGAFEAVGIFGQYMYVNPRERLVIVVLSARPKPVDETRDELADDAAFFAAVASALH
ncbi:MAG: beta-lactamase [Gammaproteobacteria bacterium]|nr:beta-lactamase [Gammaproteobacteria bacterium]